MYLVPVGLPVLWLALLDASMLALISAPILERLIIRPLRQAAVFERTTSETILEAAPDAIITIDGRGTLLSFNPAAERIFGHEAAEVLGDNVSLLMPDSLKASHELALLEHVPEQESVIIGHEREVLGKRSDGTTFPLELGVREVLDHGPVQYVGIARDLTERRSIEELRRAAAVAEESARCKNEFLANMSHEIRTPLTSIMGYTERLDDDQICAAERREAVEVITRSGHHLLDLLDGMLDFSLIEAGMLELEAVPASPFEIVEGARAIMEDAALEKGLVMTTEYPSDLPETILTDPVRMQQALVNLVGNAVRFTAQGSVRIVVGLDAADAGLLCVEVIDTGIGLAAEECERLFDPLTQADTSITRRFEGTGLGLSISKEIARMLGGDLVVESEPDRGSTFRMSVAVGDMQGVPLVSFETRRLEPPASPLAVEQTDAPLDVSVLLAEDNPLNQRLVERMLTRAGARVTCVDDGREAVRETLRAEAEGQPFDLILMDMQMPFLDGTGATAELRAHGFRSSIVALTANATEADRQACFDAGCDAFALKPISRAVLLGVVRRWAGAGSRQAV